MGNSSTDNIFEIDNKSPCFFLFILLPAETCGFFGSATLLHFRSKARPGPNLLEYGIQQRRYGHQEPDGVDVLL